MSCTTAFLTLLPVHSEHILRTKGFRGPVLASSRDGLRLLAGHVTSVTIFFLCGETIILSCVTEVLCGFDRAALCTCKIL